MKLTLISPYPDITAFGLRTISAYLRWSGYRTQMIFLPDPNCDDANYPSIRYQDHALNELAALCKGSDLIGITLMTNYFDAAVQITDKLKSTADIPIVWGGVHPTIRPEESLQYADMVCIGDGEDVILEVANRLSSGHDLADIRGLWIRSNGKIVRNPLRSIPPNLDIYPPPDYSLGDHYVLFDGHIKPLTLQLTKTFLANGTVSMYLKNIGYQTMTGRGCPHRCSYCINDTIKKLYQGQRYLRWRSSDHVIKELLWVKQYMPFVGFIWISDDAFLGRSLKSLRILCEEYKSKIGLPFSCLASPMTVTEDKMELLVDAGLFYLQMGIETGSRRIQKIFNRGSMTNERMMRAIRIINRYKDRMFPPSYDFIMDVPYETDKDKVDTLRFISEIPKPFQLQPFSLVLYPETKLYGMAKRDGFILDEKRQIYSKSYSVREPNYLGLLVSIAKYGHFPSHIMKFLIKDHIVRVLNSDPMKPFFRFLFSRLKGIYHYLKAVRKKR